MDAGPAAAFLGFLQREIGTRPVWVCPIAALGPYEKCVLRL